MSDTLSTELEAVNEMLAAIGSAPVNSIQSNTLPAEVQIAINTLRSESRKVQHEGWAFNTDYDFELARDINNEVHIPANTLSVDLEREDGTIDVVQRGLRLYDRKNKTFTFSVNPKVRLIQLLPWDDLPQPARTYITIRAARVFQDRVQGSDTIHGFTERDEFMARAAMEKDDALNEDANIFDNYDTARILGVPTRRPY